MTSVLNQVLAFVDVPAGGLVTMSHDINKNGVATVPDFVYFDQSGFELIEGTRFSITIKNNNSGSQSVNAWAQALDNPSFPGGLPALTPNPYVVAGGGGGSSSGPMLSVTDYGAVGDGVTDDTAAIQAAINAAIELNRPLYFPRTSASYLVKPVNNNHTPGVTAWCVLVPACNDLHLIGDNASITYDSEITGGVPFWCLKTINNLTVQGLKFVSTSTSQDYTVNYYPALYLFAGADTTVKDCYFINGNAVSFDSNFFFPGRFVFDRCRCLNCPGNIDSPIFSVITNSWFVKDVLNIPYQGSHAIYLFGPAQGCVIDSCFFKNIDREGIQIRAANTAWQQKRSFSITNCYFETCDTGVWCGNDDVPDVSDIVVSGCTFRNVKGNTFQGLKNGIFANNTSVYDWQYLQIFMATAQGSEAASFNLTGSPPHPNQSTGCRVVNNTFDIRHPYYGSLTIVTKPLDGMTVTVGKTGGPPRQYTFRDNPTVAGEIKIGPDERTTGDNLVAALQGDQLNTYNNLLRDLVDVFNNQFGYGGGSTSEIVVASGVSFTIDSSNHDYINVAPVIQAQFPYNAIYATQCIWPTIEGNTCVDMSILVNGCISPVVRGNYLVGSGSNAAQILGQANAFPLYQNNHWALDMTKEVQLIQPVQLLRITDGFPIVDEPELPTGQEQACLTCQGAYGIVPIGNGQAYTYLYYGIEFYDPSFPNPTYFPFRWCDGDEVILQDDLGAQTTFTFLRTNPGAGQFNTAQTLLALINATATWSAAFETFVNTGGVSNPDLLIKISVRTAGEAGNSHKIYVKRPSAYITDQQSYRSCGLILRNNTNAADIAGHYARFAGGSADMSKTAIFSPLASDMRGVFIQGVDAQSQSLAPIVYQADIIPGALVTVSHVGTPQATGNEQFFYRLR